MPTGGRRAQLPLGPRATADGVIEVPVDFSERLWAVSFALLVLCEGYGAEALRQRGMVAAGAPPDHLLAAAEGTLMDALTGPLHPWPAGAPVPSAAGVPTPALTSDHLGWWVRRANGVFVDALTFLAAHEAAHLVQRHAGAMGEAKRVLADHALAEQAARAAGAPPAEPGPAVEAARQNALEMEREADAEARELLLGAAVDESALLPRGFAAVMACAATVLFAGSFAGLRQHQHPDRDVQLRQQLEALDPTRTLTDHDVDEMPPDANDALWRVTAVALMYAAHLWGAPASFPAEVASWPHVVAYLFDHFEAQKASVAS
jgi:hypothetical protein